MIQGPRARRSCRPLGLAVERIFFSFLQIMLDSNYAQIYYGIWRLSPFLSPLVSRRTDYDSLRSPCMVQAARVYPDRAARRDRHHCRSYRTVTAGGAEGA